MRVEPLERIALAEGGGWSRAAEAKEGVAGRDACIAAPEGRDVEAMWPVVIRRSSGAHQEVIGWPVFLWH